MEITIDAQNRIVGRIATYISKQALLGHKVNVLNCEKAVIMGNKDQIMKKYTDLRKKGQPTSGPFIIRMPDRLVKRIIRGMLPYKQPRGRKALENIKCYLGVPTELKNAKIEKMESADITKRQTRKYVTIHQICKQMGGK